MSLFFTMLPIYLLGNLHCIGMCGPLVMMMGKHPYRYFYFLGRMLSFTLAGMIAGEAGAVLNLFLRQYHIPAAASLFFGGVILTIGIYSFIGQQYPGYFWLSRQLAGTNQTLSLLMLRNQAFPAFLFGFFTIALPCGQTLVVFSACALVGDIWIGMGNGLAFALLTSPSLLLAMHAHNLLCGLKPYYNKIMGACAIVVGVLSICRGLADTGHINHWILNPESPPHYHLVIF